MDLSFASFWDQLMGNPLLLLAVVLTLGVILVNGWTDAPNAIATCVDALQAAVKSDGASSQSGDQRVALAGRNSEIPCRRRPYHDREQGRA